MGSRRSGIGAALLAAFAAGACSSEGSTAGSIDAPFVVNLDAFVPPPPVVVVDAAADASSSAPPDAAVDAAVDGIVRCMPGALRCRDAVTAERCLPSGDGYRTLACGAGCGSDGCLPLRLSEGFTLHQFALEGDPADTPAAYTFEQDGLAATQTRNAMASAFVYEPMLEGVEISGRLRVESTADDDFVGWVFGWQDSSNFYLVDWKQAGQVKEPCGEAKVGVSLKRVRASGPVDRCEDLWNSDGSQKVTPLSDVTRHATGWKDETTYEFLIVFRPGDLRVRIKEGDATVVDLSSTDASFTSGRFGFYSYSQEAVRYENVRIQPR